ncbi:MAG: hypothetical protein WBE86_05075 [Candidatus Acidiferrales bacterium]
MRNRAIPVIILYFLLFVMVNWLFDRHFLRGHIAYLFAVLPALPLIVVIVLLGRYIREETDEFKRAVFVEALLWAIGLTMVLTTAWGFIEMFIPGMHVPVLWVFPLFCVMAAAAKLFIRRRFQ